ncbi:MAG: hypothetical protein ABFR53_04600 [Actinomycetota bacterium]
MRKTLIATLAVAMMAVAGPAFANPTHPHDTGCPTGKALTGVEYLTEMGYGVPGYIDDIANGGNGDGYVCARALGDGWFQVFPDATVETIYNFSDNTWFDN